MSYTITASNGDQLGTILDGTIDDPSAGGVTSLKLIGRNYSNYGQIMVDNLVHLLDNFADDQEPTSPIVGQLWYNRSDMRLKVCIATTPTNTWKIISSATADSVAPTTTIAGDIWWETVNKQLYVYDGTTPFSAAGWILVGPSYSAVKGKTGAFLDTIVDNAAGSHDVVSVYLNGVRNGIISTDSEFTPNTAITGFTTIKKGYNLINTGIFNGVAYDSDRLGNVAAANFMRSDQNNTVTGNLTMTNDSGIVIGAGSDLALTVSGTDAEITNRTSGGDISFYSNISGTNTRTLFIDGTTGELQVNGSPTTGLGVTTKTYVDNKFVDSVLTGTPVAPTASSGTSTTQIATTAFVMSAFDQTRVYKNNSHLAITDTGSDGFANLALDGVSVLTATSTGVTLEKGAQAFTWPQTTSNTAIATTSYVRTAVQRWDGSAKFVSIYEPDPGVNDTGSVNGDFWFQIES